MTSDVVATVHLVVAIYNYKGKNNDELNFKKGDVITVTQKEEGGWWEGTLENKTGWFPSNYVKDISPSDTKNLSIGNPVSAEKQINNRNLILKDIIDSEKVYVADIQNLLQAILVPLASKDILSVEEYSQVLRNLPEILDLHSYLVNLLEDCLGKSSLEQRIGHIFMTLAEKMRTVHTDYCSKHAKAVYILENYKDKLGSAVEEIGGQSPGLVYLIAGLSRPFRRIERYGGYLQEMERHMEEFHPDRGDTQRSVFVYQDLASHCAAVRRQKEQELEVLSGAVRGWEGEEPCKLGELLYMGPVKISYRLTNSANQNDRYFLVFSQWIVILSISQRLSAFVFERKISLAGVILEDTEQSRVSFELKVPDGERVTVSCPSREERLRLVDILSKQIWSPSPAQPASNMPHIPSPMHVATSKAEMNRSSATASIPGIRSVAPVLSRQLVQRTPSSSTGATISHLYPVNQHFSAVPTVAPSPATRNRIWTYSCLRPSPPITTRPCNEKSNKTNRLLRKRELSCKDDIQLEQVIETYYNLMASSRQTVKSALLESPQVLIAEEEKIIVEDIQGSCIVVEEKSLVDTVYALRDLASELQNQVRELQTQVSFLTREVEQLKSHHP